MESDRIKQFLMVAPMAALVVAVAYLQGYWGYFGILIFPYLSFAEVVAYSAAPMFGFFALFIFGGLFGAADGINRADRPKTTRLKIWKVFEATLVLLLCVVIVYLDRPEQWLIVPLGVLGVFGPRLIDILYMEGRFLPTPTHAVVVFFALVLVVGSFGWGRYQAEKLVQKNSSDVSVAIDREKQDLKFVGKAGSYFFFLEENGILLQYPDDSISVIAFDVNDKN
ncbi:hypothetical protein ACFL00_00305 [Pseudomonadota bacterium]